MAKVTGNSPQEDFPIPEQVVLVPVDLDPSNECVRVVTMAFVRGTEPAVNCSPRRTTPPPGDVPAPTPGLPATPQAGGTTGPGALASSPESTTIPAPRQSP
jgi:hypothetical protein